MSPLYEERIICMSGKTVADPKVFSAMQTGKPYKTFKKVILARALVHYLDPFSGEPRQAIIKGRPDRDPDVFFDVWSEQEYVFFKRMNVYHIKHGIIIECPRPEEPADKEKTIESYTDEELDEILKSKFMTLNKILNKIETEAVLFRLLERARHLELTEKLIKAVENRIAEVQNPSILQQEG